MPKQAILLLSLLTIFLEEEKYSFTFLSSLNRFWNKRSVVNASKQVDWRTVCWSKISYAMKSTYDSCKVNIINTKQIYNKCGDIFEFLTDHAFNNNKWFLFGIFLPIRFNQIIKQFILCINQFILHLVNNLEHWWQRFVCICEKLAIWLLHYYHESAKISTSSHQTIF